METARDFISLVSKFTAYGDCSHEIKRCLLLGRKAMTNLVRILKAETLLYWNVPSSQNYGLPVFMYWCESWTIRKAEHWSIDTFELRCWRRLLREPGTARISNQSILKEISPEYSWKDWRWSWNSNMLVTWCKELTSWKRPWCWKDWRKEEKGMTEHEMGGLHHQLNGHEFEQALGVGDGQGSLTWCPGVAKSRTWLRNWIELSL